MLISEHIIYNNLTMLHEIIAPPRHLEKYIRHFWVLEYDRITTGDSLFKVFARKFPRLVIQHNEGNSAIYEDQQHLPVSYLSGLNAVSYTCGIQPSVSITGVSFYPHAIKTFFRFDVSEMINELPDLCNFVPRAWISEIVETKDWRQRIAILVRFFTNRLLAAKEDDRLCAMSWQLIDLHPDLNTIRKISRACNISERQLERRFKACNGYSPKQFLRISRFEKSLLLLRNGGFGKLSDVAHALNYSDQSHFIREFREFSGHTPTEYLRMNKVYEENAAFIVKNDP
ncbi:AraC family transcriptional regulator [Chitinophaga sp. XS-30]|uniref:helix-turn-helix domain-containing protein n=1 Tax=Chitinophaga sp. XS-30 TaxID=2604421 RepID=UPI00143D22C5|nr:helix-turn-helix transcriptional regulator [Chitinophaga sp. XS-30]